MERKKPECRKMSGTVERLQEESSIVLHENVISTANLLLRIPETIGKSRVYALSRVKIQIS